jgi:hypothetical protein
VKQIVRQPRHHRRVDHVFIGSWHAHPQARAHISRAELRFHEPGNGVWASDDYGVVADVEID